MNELDRTIETYRADGVVCLRSIVDPGTIDNLVHAVGQFRANPVGRFGALRSAGGGEFFIANYLAESSTVIRDFVLNGPLPPLAKALTGASRVRFFYDQLFAKDPGSESPTPWHNDEPFWPITGAQTISMWVALAPVNESSGGLEYVRGSHLWNKRFRPQRPGTAALPEKEDGMEPAPDFDDPGLRDAHSMLRWDMEPGDVLCHHPLVLHGAAGNSGTSLSRIGLSVRYFGDDAVWNPGEYSMPLSRDPDVVIGQYPGDDEVFPLVA